MSTTNIDRPKIRIKSSLSKDYQKTKEILDSLKLCTVCEEARCPNMSECWHNKTATFMLLGDVCTRNCKFCAVKNGIPVQRSLAEEKKEVEKLLEAIKLLELKYVVLTSVTRDDFVDGGASIFAYAVYLLKSAGLKVEILTPDFAGGLTRQEMAIMQFMNGNGEYLPDVFAHNIETVRSLTPITRDSRASYDNSLKLLRDFKEAALRRDFHVYTKSGLMLGMGESESEVYQLFSDLREADVDFLTLGQYLSPTKDHHPVKEYLSEEKFQRLKEVALSSDFAFKAVVSGTLVRSSYMAHKMLEH